MLTHHTSERFASVEAKIKEIQGLLEAVVEKDKLLQLRVDQLENGLAMKDQELRRLANLGWFDRLFKYKVRH